jgi:hypothetical protein
MGQTKASMKFEKQLFYTIVYQTFNRILQNQTTDVHSKVIRKI